MMGSASLINGSTAFHFEVSCPNERPLLNILRRFVSNVAEEMGFANDDVVKIEMAVDEACANAIIHGTQEAVERPDGGIALKLRMSPDALTIQIRDHGAGMKRKSSRFGTVQDYQNQQCEDYHGLGMLIMQQFMDQVEFTDHPERGTLVTLCKFLNRSGAGGTKTEPSVGAAQE